MLQNGNSPVVQGLCKENFEFKDKMFFVKFLDLNRLKAYIQRSCSNNNSKEMLRKYCKFLMHEIVCEPYWAQPTKTSGT